MPSKFMRGAVASLSCVVLLTGSAWAQKSQPARVRGTIESADNDVLKVKTRDGQDVTVHLTPDYKVAGLVPSSLDKVKVGSFIGVAGIPQPDGSQKALEVHIFPESMRGTGEGFREWDVQPHSSMTNATVAEAVTANDGQTLTVKYKGGDKKLIVSPDTPVVAFVPGEKSELKPGAKIITLGTKLADGSIEASRVTVGRDGVTPPM